MKPHFFALVGAIGLAAFGAEAATLSQNFDDPGTAYAGQKLPSPAFTNQFQNAAPGPTVMAADANSDGQYLQLKNVTRNVFTTAGFDAVGTEKFSKVEGSFDFRLTCQGARVGFSGGGCADGFAFTLLDTEEFGTSGQVTSASKGMVAISEGSDVSDYDSVTGEALRSGLSVGLAIFAPPPSYNPGDIWVSDGNRGSGFLLNEPGLDFVTGINATRGEFLKLEFAADFVLDQLSMSISNGTTVTTVFDQADISAFGLDPYNSRLGFGARSGDAGLFVDLDNINLTFTPYTPVASVPVPASLGFAFAGLAALAGLRRRLV